MRSTISAQSWASVPPVPPTTVTTASPESYSSWKSASSWSRSELLGERSDRRSDLVLHAAVHRVQLGRVLVVGAEPLVAVEPLRQTGVLGRDACCVLLFVPEARRAQLLLELADARSHRIRVKGNHGPSRAGPRSPSAGRRAKRRRPWRKASRPWCWTASLQPARSTRVRRRGTSCTSCRSRTSRGRCGRSSPCPRRHAAACAGRPRRRRRRLRRSRRTPPRSRPRRRAPRGSTRAPPSSAGASVALQAVGVLRRELRVEEREHDLLADRLAQLLEHLVPLGRVLDERILLRHRPEVDALAEVIHVLEVLAPARVDDLEDHVALELA